QAPPRLQQGSAVLSGIDRACRKHEFLIDKPGQFWRQGNFSVALKADELMREPGDVNGWRHIALRGIQTQVSSCTTRHAGKPGCVLQSLIQPAAEKGRHLGA